MGKYNRSLQLARDLMVMVVAVVGVVVVVVVVVINKLTNNKLHALQPNGYN